MQTISTGEFFARALQGYGVTHVFFVPAILHSGMAALEDTDVARVVTHHEAAAAFMADGYARAARRPGVCLAQQVGGTNLAAGLKDAFLAGSPVVSMSGGPQPDYRYRYLYQVLEDFNMFESVTKFNAVVEKPSRFPDLLRQAFRAATSGAPGPVHLELPGRLGECIVGEIDTDVYAEERFSRIPPYRLEADSESIERALALLQAAERPVIIAGGGVGSSAASEELVAFAEKLGIPVAVSLNGKDSIAENHPLCLGLLGSYGRWCTNKAVEAADLVFFIGSRAGGLTTNNWQSPKVGVKAIQLDIDPMEIGRNYPLAVGLQGDVKVTLQRMLAKIETGVDRKAWGDEAREMVNCWRGEVTPAQQSDASPIRPERLVREISEFLPNDSLVVADTGHAAIWTGTMLSLNRPGQRYIRCAGTLGWAFPASLGAKCALPNSTVVCFTGDGGLYYHLAELETAARAGINTIIVVNNNAALQQVRRGIDRAYGGQQRGRAGEMWNFRSDNDLAKVATELGCLGLRVDKPEGIRPALEQAQAANRPALIDVRTDVDASPDWS